MNRKIEQYRDGDPQYMAHNMSRAAIYWYIKDSQNDILELYNQAILRPMNTAPHDGTEILAYSNSGNFHPVSCREGSPNYRAGYWRMRWHPEYSQHDSDFMDWISMPVPAN